MTTIKNRKSLKQCKRIVVKVGTNILVDDCGKPNMARLRHLTKQIMELRKEGKEVILVSSGAIAVGLDALEIKRRPTAISELQATASVGQARLQALYNKLFAKHDVVIGQVLLTHDDLKNRKRHLNARNTFLSLLKRKVLPVVNENDVVAVDEIKFGDNDVLSSLVAVLIEADLLIILTTPNGFYDLRDKNNPLRIEELNAITKQTMALAQGKASALSTGGMTTKLQAAQIQLKAGGQTVIASGLEKKCLSKVIAGQDVGTLITPDQEASHKNTSRHYWLDLFQRPSGTLQVDAGAAKALCQGNKSLLPVGVKTVEGRFQVGDLVSIIDSRGRLLAKGLVEYSATEASQIIGKSTADLKAILGYQGKPELVHKNNLVLETNWWSSTKQ